MQRVCAVTKIQLLFGFVVGEFLAPEPETLQVLYMDAVQDSVTQ